MTSRTRRVWFLFMHLFCSSVSPGEESVYKKNLPQSILRCLEFFDHYISCFHPKALLLKQIGRCHESWLHLRMLLQSPSPLSEDSDISWIYQFKEEFEHQQDKMNSLV